MLRRVDVAQLALAKHERDVLQLECVMKVGIYGPDRQDEVQEEQHEEERKHSSYSWFDLIVAGVWGACLDFVFRITAV